jgi:hypothetical protein
LTKKNKKTSDQVGDDNIQTKLVNDDVDNDLNNSSVDLDDLNNSSVDLDDLNNKEGRREGGSVDLDDLNNNSVDLDDLNNKEGRREGGSVDLDDFIISYSDCSSDRDLLKLPASPSSSTTPTVTAATVSLSATTAAIKQTHRSRKHNQRDTGFINRYKYRSKQIDWRRKVNCASSLRTSETLAGKNRVRGDSRVWRAPRNNNNNKLVKFPHELRDFPVPLTVV